MDPKMCPGDSDLVAYICRNDIYLQYGRINKRVTNFGKPCSQWPVFCSADKPVIVGSNGQDLKKSAGTPSFIIQEEFDRYSGIWWAPGDASGEFCLPVIPLCLSLSVLIPERFF